MGRYIAVVLISVLPGMSLAHPGHLVDVAGHNHWVAGAAIGTAVVLGIWAGLRGRKSDKASSDEASGDAPSSETETGAEGETA